ncbi:MAG: ATP-dependent DNA helicase [Proteobacteria bacterium]|nr:ATP-dependent DNA helicase [Pseudomonadota bacterium]
MQRLLAWGAPERADEPELCWVDVGSHGVQLHRTPISVADVFRRQRLGLGGDTPLDEAREGAMHESEHEAELVQAFAAVDAMPADAQPADELQAHDLQALMAGGDALSPPDEARDTPEPPPRRAWIFTSATLAVKNDFRHFTEALGLEDAACAAWSSPYDYPSQAMLYVPQGLPLPNDPGHTDAVVDAALPLIRANRGRAFVLCTSLRAVARAAERLKQAFQDAADPYPVLQQGDAPRPTLLDDFRHAGNAVLVGSHSFWEGIDVKGDALTLVVIDKLPFAPPDDPVLAKRLELLTQSGGNPFMQHQVPQAIIALKQGAGRLIRSETDRGVLMICDMRLIDKPYGRRIWQSLPPMKRTRVQDEVVAFLATL